MPGTKLIIVIPTRKATIALITPTTTRGQLLASKRKYKRSDSDPLGNGFLNYIDFQDDNLRTRNFNNNGKTKLETGEYGLSFTGRINQLW